MVALKELCYYIARFLLLTFTVLYWTFCTAYFSCFLQYVCFWGNAFALPPTPSPPPPPAEVLKAVVLKSLKYELNHQMKQRQLNSAWKTFNEHNNKVLNHLQFLSSSMRLNTGYINSTRGTSLSVYELQSITKSPPPPPTPPPANMNQKYLAIKQLYRVSPVVEKVMLLTVLLDKNKLV